MPDLQTTLTQRFRAAVLAAFGKAHEATDPMIRRSDRADYQANLAMGLGKVLGRPPRDVATALVAALDVADLCEKVEVAGPGFVNLTLRADYVADTLNAIVSDERAGTPRVAQPQTVIIDYSAPNVAKEMHVGHLRSTFLGDALARTLEFVGHRVVRQNHVGDWGTQFGMLIEHLLDLGESEGTQELSMGELNAFYKEARQKFDSVPGFAERSRHRVVLLQSGDTATLQLWRQLVDSSARYFNAVYERMGVTLVPEDARGESFFNPLLAGIAEELQSRGIAEISDGALCVFLPGFVGKDGEAVPLIVRKQDGGFGYAATDLAALRYRVETLGGNRLLYVVGAPQRQHLTMVFEVAKRAGWLQEPVRAEHVAFGSILGTDKKMFKTRSGESVRLIDLLDEAVERADQAVGAKSPELDAETRARVARQVGIGAVKYADLSTDRIKDYVFDWNRMLAFEGNTGPYLQYAYTRIRSILRKAGSGASGARIQLSHPREKTLALELLDFGRVITQVSDELEPHKLCTQLYQLATAFTAFYEACPVLKAETAELRDSRLTLATLSANVLKLGLRLLGIEAPEQM